MYVISAVGSSSMTPTRIMSCGAFGVMLFTAITVMKVMSLSAKKVPNIYMKTTKNNLTNNQSVGIQVL